MKLAGVVVSGAILIILIMGGALFANMYQRSKNSDVEIITMQKELSLQEIKTHNTQQDCWTYIGGQVFDATKVIVENPEHAAVLTTVCGKDGSDVYTVQKYAKQEFTKEDIVKLREALGTYQIGLLSPQ